MPTHQWLFDNPKLGQCFKRSRRFSEIQLGHFRLGNFAFPNCTSRLPVIFFKTRPWAFSGMSGSIDSVDFIMRLGTVHFAARSAGEGAC
jgi:hypothetical protein